MRNPHEFGDGHCNRALVDYFQQPTVVFRKDSDQQPTVFLPPLYTAVCPMIMELDETRGRGSEHFNILERGIFEIKICKKKKEVSFGETDVIEVPLSCYMSENPRGGIPSREFSNPKRCKRKYPIEQAIAAARQLAWNLQNSEVIGDNSCTPEKSPMKHPSDWTPEKRLRKKTSEEEHDMRKTKLPKLVRKSSDDERNEMIGMFSKMSLSADETVPVCACDSPYQKSELD